MPFGTEYILWHRYESKHHVITKHKAWSYTVTEICINWTPAVNDYSPHWVKRRTLFTQERVRLALTGSGRPCSATVCQTPSKGKRMMPLRCECHWGFNVHCDQWQPTGPLPPAAHDTTSVPVHLTLTSLHWHGHILHTCVSVVEQYHILIFSVTWLRANQNTSSKQCILRESPNVLVYYENKRLLTNSSNYNNSCAQRQITKSF